MTPAASNSDARKRNQETTVSTPGTASNSEALARHLYDVSGFHAADSWATETSINRSRYEALAEAVRDSDWLAAHDAEVARAAAKEAGEALWMAERVCALTGWTATDGRSDRGKALTQAWMEWAATRPGMSGRAAWPDLDDEGIEALARKRDQIRSNTIHRIAREEGRADG